MDDFKKIPAPVLNQKPLNPQDGFWIVYSVNFAAAIAGRLSSGGAIAMPRSKTTGLTIRSINFGIYDSSIAKDVTPGSIIAIQNTVQQSGNLPADAVANQNYFYISGNNPWRENLYLPLQVVPSNQAINFSFAVQDASILLADNLVVQINLFVVYL